MTNEQKAAEGNQASQAQANANDRVQPEAPLAVRQVNEAFERSQQILGKMDEKLAQMNEAYARNILGGVTTQTQPVVKEETPKEYIKRIMREGYPKKAQ